MSADNLTNLAFVPDLLLNASQKRTVDEKYWFVITDKLIVPLGGTNKYYRNERCTINIQLHSLDRASTEPNKDLNMREILTELESKIHDKNQTHPGYEVDYSSNNVYSYGDPAPISIEFTRLGVPV